MAKVKSAKITDLIPDDKNFNKGTEYGNSLVEKSFEKFGAGRSILIDKNNKIIAGNKSIENAASLGGFEDIIIVESDGKKIIAVKRNDIDLDTPEGREMALADNASAKANILIDAELVAAELGEAVTTEWIGNFKPADGDSDKKDLSGTTTTEFKIEVIAHSEQEQEKIYNQLLELNLECRLLTL